MGSNYFRLHLYNHHQNSNREDVDDDEEGVQTKKLRHDQRICMLRKINDSQMRKHLIVYDGMAL